MEEVKSTCIQITIKQTDRSRFIMCKCRRLHTFCGGIQSSSMVASSNTLLIYGQDFKVITCGITESSEGVGPTCDVGHLLSIPPHLKPNDSISVIDPIWCRVPPGESDEGSRAAFNT